MDSEINKYFFDKFCEEGYLFVECNNGSRYLLSPAICSSIPELPPNAWEYPDKRKSPKWPKWISFLWRSFSREDDNRVPSPEHYSLLQMGFQSSKDTVYFMTQGAVVHFSKEKGKEVEIRFYTRQQAEMKGILIENYKQNSSYQNVPIDREGTGGLYPLEGGFIVAPGFCSRGELCDMDVYERNHIDNSRSIDFVQDSFCLAQYPEESRAFRELPSYFCKLSGSSFDYRAWELAMTAETLPLEHNCVHPFYKNGLCIAELVIVNLIWGTSYYPYHDSYVFVLRYSPAVEPCVMQLVDLVLEKFPSIKRAEPKDVES